jgi:hypothetical protein
MACKDHIIGVCAGMSIVSFDDIVVEKFLANLKDFSTSKKQVNHPGFMHVGKYCTECGTKMDYEIIKSRWDELIEAAIPKQSKG